MSRINMFGDALEEMVWQFAERGTKKKKPILWTGGLSALETAFAALGWDDPHYIEEGHRAICDVKGCANWVTAGGDAWRETGHWSVCREHSQSSRAGEPQPKMKQRAIDEEASRDERGYLPMPKEGKEG